MADTFLDPAGGLQTSPTVNVVIKDQMPYQATDGSLQTALSVVAEGGGDIIAPGDTITVAPSNGDTAAFPATAQIENGTVTAVLPDTVALVENDQNVAVQLNSGFNAGTSKASVNEGYLTYVILPAGVALASDGDTKPLSKADNTGLLAMVTVHVGATDDMLENVALPANYTVFEDGQDDFNILDYGSGGGQVAGIARVSNNEGSVQLANATTKIAINAVPITVVDQGGKTAGATIAVDQGNWQNFPFANGTDAIVSDGQQVTMTVDGAQKVVTFTVAGGVITAETTADPA